MLEAPSKRRLIQFGGLIGSLSIFFFTLVGVPNVNRPLTAVAGIVLMGGSISALFFLFWIAKDFDKISRSTEKKTGGRFCRVVSGKQEISGMRDSWAKRFGYVQKSQVGAYPLIFAKKDYPLYPIFIGFEILDQGSLKIEGWVSTYTRDYPLKGGFQMLGAIRVGAKDLNALLRELGEPPV